MNATRKFHVNVEPIPGASYHDNRLIVDGFTTTFGIGHVPEGESGRKQSHGCLVPGPWAFVYGLATVIDNRGGTAADIARQRREGKLVEAKLGDILIVAGHEYRIEPANDFGRPSRTYVDLIPA